jgi:2-oxoglutarate dehydrogenase E2 component (dihydrolipoamide succinyltransferase)
MGKYLLKLPKMGESVAEASLIKWRKEEGDTVEIDDVIVEIATDKVDTDVPSEFSGVLIEKRFSENDVIQVGEVIAVIKTSGGDSDHENETKEKKNKRSKTEEKLIKIKEETSVESPPTFTLSEPSSKFEIFDSSPDNKITTELITKNLTNDSITEINEFYSPLVKNIAKAENLSNDELRLIKGTGKDNRVTKRDLLVYLNKRNYSPSNISDKVNEIGFLKPSLTNENGDQIIEMSRMAKLTASHMIMSKQTSAHVQSFIEADLTNIWEWREKNKQTFQEREGEKLTFTPLLITALIRALKDFPLLNSSVEGNKIIKKREINIGMATAMADGNLIVPVIRNANHLNLVGLAKSVNDLAHRARSQNLKPDEVQGGTYTFTNIGNFGSLTGIPIINQPQVGIVAVGVIRKMPSVMESKEGDSIAIRKKVIISHSYDHRIINGALGGKFIKSMADFLENWDTQQTI